MDELSLLRADVLAFDRELGDRARSVAGPSSATLDAWRQVRTAEIPVPGSSANAGARVLQRFELQALERRYRPRRHSAGANLIGRDEVRERAAFPFVPV